MIHPPAVCEQAQRLERLLQRVEAGEALEQVCADLGLNVQTTDLPKLQARYEAGGRSWEALVNGRYGHPQKAHSTLCEWMYERKREDETLTARELAEEVGQRFPVELSIGHVNYLLRKVELTRPPGRPSRRQAKETTAPASPAPSNESLANAGLFFLEGAKQALGVAEIVETCLAEACDRYQEAQPEMPLRVTQSEPETNWHKLDHLLYLPVLGLTRPRDLYYYQGEGLKVLYGFTYKYLTLEHFLGQLTRLQVGYPLAEALAQCYSQAWYPGQDPLFLFADWHVKPHWTKHPAHSGHVAMWERVMPGTKQLLLNGPAGHLLGGWNHWVDTHLTHVLVDLEADLATKLQRPIAYTIVDSEAGGLPIAQRYAAAGRDYISVLPRQGDQRLAAFELLGEWEAVVGDPEREAVDARWKDLQKAQADPRRLVLMRQRGDTDPTRVYAGRIPTSLSAGEVPARFRQRWSHQERVIRQMVNGANLNANFGYTYRQVSNRTQRRRWEEAQAAVEVNERGLAEQEEALTNLRHKLASLRQSYGQTRAALVAEIEARQLELARCQKAGQTTRRREQGLHSREQRLMALTACFQRRRRRLLEKIVRRRTRRSALRRELEERRTARDAIDTDSLCRERDLEKDQIMLDLQILLTSLHDWARNHYFAPEWQRLELDTAIEMIYRKPGRVHWGREEIEVVLDPYRYRDQQQAMEESGRRFNAAQVRWRDGRLLRIRVAREKKLQLCNCQSAIQT
jgi:transposase